MDEYYRDPSSYNSYTAIKGGDGYVYPIRTKTDHRPGFYPTGCLDFFKQPVGSEVNEYTQMNIIDFRNVSSLREVIQTKQKLLSEERTILTTIDNVFTPDISDNDTPEMKALKQAVIDKHIDLDKYEPRFGPNYNNDKRLMKKNSITFGKLRSIADALDMKLSMTIEDANPDVPNPIGRAITVELTGSSNDLEEGD